jgi:predicted transcriptional regulator
MPNFTVRLQNTDLVSRFDELARQHRLSRNAFIDLLIQDAVADGPIPRLVGEGFQATTDAQGIITLIKQTGFVAGGRKNLTEQEEAAYQTAFNLADRGNNWTEVRRILTQAGFTVSLIREDNNEK